MPDGWVPFRPRRGRCRSCGRTHVLLPAVLWSRRRYGALVIMTVLVLGAEAAAAGRAAARPRAAGPGGGRRMVPPSTARPGRAPVRSRGRRAPGAPGGGARARLGGWALTEPAMDPALTSRQRGAVVRDLASREHQDPDGRKASVSRRTIDRWIVARREGGFDALIPSPRQCPPRLGTETEDLAAGLKMENPARTAAQVRRILAAQGGAVPSLRTIH